MANQPVAIPERNETLATVIDISFYSCYFVCQLISIAERTLTEADLDQDNMISFNEFKEIMAKVDIEQRMSIRFLS